MYRVIALQCYVEAFSPLLLLLAMQQLPAFLHGSQPDSQFFLWLTKNYVSES